MLSFFSKINSVTDIEWLGTDMHSHILPGIDDGSPDVDTSLRFVKSLENLGFSHLIATPHIYKELYPNNKQTILAARKALQSAMDASHVSLTLDTAAEYMVDQDLDLSVDLCSLQEQALLIEMSCLNESRDISERIFHVEVKGLKPILAHPERYTFYFKDKSRLKRFKDRGCLMQLNLLSILGYYGKEVKQLSEYLLKEKIYDLAGTDLHHDRHLETLINGVQSGKLYGLIGSYPFKNKEMFGSILV